MEITIKDLENDLKSLPKELLQQVSDYIAFLKQKYNGQVNEDWTTYLSTSQKNLFKKESLIFKKEELFPTMKQSKK